MLSTTDLISILGRKNMVISCLKKFKLPSAMTGSILSHRDYCNTIWSNTTKSNSERTARFIFDDFDSPSEILYQKLNWLPITQKIEQVCV